MEREEGGTPDILGSIRLGLCFLLKDTVRRLFFCIWKCVLRVLGDIYHAAAFTIHPPTNPDPNKTSQPTPN